MVVKNTQIYGVEISGKWFASKKIESRHFCYPQENIPQLRERTKKTNFKTYCFKLTFLKH